MFAIPYGALDVKTSTTIGGVTSDLTVTCNKDIGLAIATAFVTTFGDSVVYDLQILPYCPVREYIQSDGTFDIRGVEDKFVSPIYFSISGVQNSIPVSYVFYCTRSNLNFPLKYRENNEWKYYSVNIEDYKKSYNTDMYRLSSPNMAASFEFSPAQNGGVDYFSVSATYKPINPYVRVRPNFKRMFGEDFKDGRGLILQGDWSVPTVSNA